MGTRDGSSSWDNKLMRESVEKGDTYVFSTIPKGRRSARFFFIAHQDTKAQFELFMISPDKIKTCY